jgi:hypothetical protein
LADPQQVDAMLEKQLWKMREDQTTEEMGEPKTSGRRQSM